MKARTATRRVVVFLSLAIFLVTAATAATAHSGTQSYVYLEIFDTTIEGRVEYPISELNEVLGLDIPEDAEAAVEQGDRYLDIIHEYSSEHLSLSALDGTEWPLEFGELTSLEVADGDYIIANFVVDREFDSVPREFNATYDGIIHEKTDRDALLIIATDFGSGTFKNEASHLLRYTPGNIDQVVDLGETSFWSGFTAVVGLGVEHIRIGSDHILFILALVLPSVLVFTRRWEPSASFGSSLWRVLKIVTMFTVAHTITLTLGGLGVVELPPAFVETTIAISIALAALHNLRPVVVNKEWLIAFAFGLFHGFGFAGLLSELGLTQSRRVVSLLGFNLGIELGQAVIIILLFPALFLARRTRAYQPAMNIGSVILIVVAILWAIDRTFGFEVGTDTWVEAVVLWPRSAFVIAAIYAVAAFLYQRDRSRGALLPMYGAPEAEPEDERVLANV